MEIEYAVKDQDEFKYT